MRRASKLVSALLLLSCPAAALAVTAPTTPTFLMSWDRLGSASGLIVPLNVETDAQGDVFLLDQASDHVYKLDRVGTPLIDWGSPGSGPGQFNGATCLAVDRDGNVYFVEMTTPRIMRLGADGVLATYREKSNNANGLVIDAQGRRVK